MTLCEKCVKKAAPPRPIPAIFKFQIKREATRVTDREVRALASLMVRFGQYLRHHEVPEWSNQYVNYAHLSKLLVRAHAARQTLRGGGPSAPSAAADHASATASSVASPPTVMPSSSSSSSASLGGGAPVLRRRGSVVSTEALLGNTQARASPPSQHHSSSSSGSTGGGSNSNHTIALPTAADFLSRIPAAALTSSDEREFFVQLHAEWRRMDEFFVRELDFFAARSAQLHEQTVGLRDEASWIAEHENNLSSNDSSQGSSSSPGDHTSHRTSAITATAKSHAQHVQRLRAAVKDQYHGLSLLLNFRVLNHTALSKLLARHAKASAWSGAAAALMPVIEQSNFYRSERLSELVYDCEVCATSLGQR
jgi:hypothetical protein